MTRLATFLAIGRITAISLLLTACANIVDPRFYDEYTVINQTGTTIRFVAGDNELTLEAGDTVSYDDFKHIFLTSYYDNKMVEVGDSVLPLYSGELCWPYNCETTNMGNYVYIRTYVIDSDWLINAYEEQRDGECKEGADHYYYYW